jgi:hypothetical protein
VILVSLDIDGTLEGGDPPGPIPLEFARRLQALGALVGSSSGRTLSDQQRFWLAGGVEIDFTILKHQLPELPGKYDCGRYLHIGDTSQDLYFARLAGFEFWHVDSLEKPVPGEQAAQAMIELLLVRMSGHPQAGGPGQLG